MPGLQGHPTLPSTNIRQSKMATKLVRKPTSTSNNSQFSIKSHVPKNPNMQFVIGPPPQTNPAQIAPALFPPSRQRTKLQSKPQIIQKLNPKFVIKPSAVPKPLSYRPRIEIISHNTASRSFSSTQTTPVTNKNHHNNNNNSVNYYAGAISSSKPKTNTYTPSTSAYQPKPLLLPPSVNKGKLKMKSKTVVTPYKSSGFIPQPDNFVLPSSLKNKIKSQLPFRITTTANRFNPKSKSISNFIRNRSKPKYVVRSAKSVQNDSRHVSKVVNKSKPHLRRTKSKTSTYSSVNSKKIGKPSKYVIRSKHSYSPRNHQQLSQNFRTRSKNLHQMPNAVKFKYQVISRPIVQNVQNTQSIRQSNGNSRIIPTGFSYQMSPPNKQSKSQLPSLFPIYNQVTRMRSEQRPRFANW